MDPDRAFNMLFTKSTASLTGPDDDIVTPPHVSCWTTRSSSAS